MQASEILAGGGKLLNPEEEKVNLLGVKKARLNQTPVPQKGNGAPPT